MTSFYDSYDYYKKMLQLQEKLRKSEEERIRLEERFKTLMQESRNRHYTCISRLRLRYIEFLEEQRSKDDRSHKLLETLNNVDNSLVLMTAKINRLNVLKEQYESYHRGINATRSLPENTIHTVTDTENINPKRNTTPRYISYKVKSRSLSQTSSPALNLNNEIQNKHHDDGIRLINQPVNYNQNNSYRDGIQSLQHLPYKLPYCRIIPKNSLREPDVSYLSKFATKQTDTTQIAPNIVVSGCINSETSQGKLSDVPQNWSKSEDPQNHLKPRVVTRCYRPEKSKILLNNTHLRLNRYTPKPIIIKQNVPDTSLLSASNSSERGFQNYLDYSLRNLDRLQESDVPKRSSISSEPTVGRFTSKGLNSVGILPTNCVQKNIDNELDEYIDKIRKLHRDNNAQSLKKIYHEEDANDSTCDISLSENRSTKNFPQNIEKVLELAGDLASRSANINNADNFQEARKNEDRNQSTHSSIPVSEENHAVYSDIDEGHEISAEAAKDKISADAALYEPKLDSHEDTEKLENQNFDDTSDLELQGDKIVTSMVSSNDKFTEQITENLHHKEHFKEYGVHVSKETEVDQCSFDIVEELEPWNLNSVQKQIQNIQLTEETEDESDKDEIKQGKETDGVYIAESRVEEQDEKAEEMDAGNISDYPKLEENTMDNRETEINDISVSPHENVEYVDDYIHEENNIENPESASYKLAEQEDVNNVQKEECYEANRIPNINQDDTQEIILQDREDNDQNCFEEGNRVENYMHSVETDQFNATEEYGYNENMPYEDNQDLQYDQNVFDNNNQQQEYKEYEQESNEQHNSENQYEHDFNMQYADNLDQQDACYQQTNPTQVAEIDVDQSTKYAEIPDLNQPGIEQEKEDQQSYEYKQLQEKTNDQEVEETSVNFSAAQNKSMKRLTENETNQEKDVKESLLDSDTDSTIEKNITNTESDFDFN